MLVLVALHFVCGWAWWHLECTLLDQGYSRSVENRTMEMAAPNVRIG